MRALFSPSPWARRLGPPSGSMHSRARDFAVSLRLEFLISTPPPSRIFHLRGLTERCAAR